MNVLVIANSNMLTEANMLAGYIGENSGDLTAFNSKPRVLSPAPGLVEHKWLHQSLTSTQEDSLYTPARPAWDATRELIDMDMIEGILTNALITDTLPETPGDYIPADRLLILLGMDPSTVSAFGLTPVIED